MYVTDINKLINTYIPLVTAGTLVHRAWWSETQPSDVLKELLRIVSSKLLKSKSNSLKMTLNAPLIKVWKNQNMNK